MVQQQPDQVVKPAVRGAVQGAFVLLPPPGVLDIGARAIAPLVVPPVLDARAVGVVAADVLTRPAAHIVHICAREPAAFAIGVDAVLQNAKIFHFEEVNTVGGQAKILTREP